MSNAPQRVAYCCLAVLIALYVVGAVSNGSLRHEVQTLPLWFPIVAHLTTFAVAVTLPRWSEQGVWTVESVTPGLGERTLPSRSHTLSRRQGEVPSVTMSRSQPVARVSDHTAHMDES